MPPRLIYAAAIRYATLRADMPRAAFFFDYASASITPPLLFVAAIDAVALR